jgi:hypothetical protein
MPATIADITLLPSSPYNDSDLVGLMITMGIPNYYRVRGADLDDIESVRWYPRNPGSVEFTMRELILVDKTLGTFMVMITDNYLNDTNRQGRLSFRLRGGNCLHFPVITYGPVSAQPLWTSPSAGLITG